MDGETNHSGQMEKADILKTELGVLRREHRQLDAQIIDLEHATAPDALHIRRLKQRKLRLKDDIARIEDRLYPDILA